MIKSFIFENFKSFEKAELNLEALTSLIGTNSSGKSNAIEGIHILADTATGLELGTIPVIWIVTFVEEVNPVVGLKLRLLNWAV